MEGQQRENRAHESQTDAAVSRRELALEELASLRRLLDDSHKDYEQTKGARSRAKLDDAIRSSAGALSDLLGSEYELPVEHGDRNEWPWLKLRQAVAALQGRLSSAALNTPAVLEVRDLHDWVRRPAEPLIAGGHYREAVEAAATSIDHRTREKIGGSPDYNTRLMRSVLGSHERGAGPRLVLRASDGVPAERSAQKALADFAAGVFGYVRNPVAHSVLQPSAIEALEYLAVMSVLARAIDRCDLLHLPEEE